MRVVVIGGGFGGLQTVKHLRRAPVEITLVDRRNFHLFQPLAYQVATGALAAKVGRPRAARAVGTVMNRNPIPIVLPCHRVLGANGSLTGYAGGLDRKLQLLTLEGAILA